MIALAQHWAVVVALLAQWLLPTPRSAVQIQSLANSIHYQLY